MKCHQYREPSVADCAECLLGKLANVLSWLVIIGAVYIAGRIILGGAA
jgi:hypothetical protein